MPRGTVKDYEDKKRAKLGSGKRFGALVDELKGKGHDEESAKAIAATIGRKKYGAKKMAMMAAHGRARKG